MIIKTDRNRTLLIPLNWKIGLLLILLSLGCDSESEVFLFEMNENWGKCYAGDTSSINYELQAYKKGRDTIYYTTNYYPNGIIKCKTIHINDCLESVEFVNDTNGNRIDFGKILNGNGYVKSYTFQGILEYSGEYIDGNKEGWWIYYHFSGEVLDSTLYKKGYNVSDTDTTWIGHIGQYKNNLYN